MSQLGLRKYTERVVQFILDQLRFETFGNRGIPKVDTIISLNTQRTRRNHRNHLTSVIIATTRPILVEYSMAQSQSSIFLLATTG
ncbi:hypothetical protein MKX03_032856 [Papaver bracteatum]|nr:hypothetical protein MKX03_032856 [Papaver bracteatum]